MFRNSLATNPLFCSGNDLSSRNNEENILIRSHNDGGDPNQLTPQPDIEGEMETCQAEPLPPLRLKVQLPTRQSFLANGVHHLEVVLLYGHLEQHALMIDIHGPMVELPIQKQNESEIPISHNPINSFPSFPLPLPNHGEVVVEQSLVNPASPPRKKTTARRRRKMTQSTTCKTCHKIFANKFTAATHSFVHLSQEEKEAIAERWKYKCYFCSRQFRTPSHLHIHLLVHTREKPHPCDKCRKLFTMKHNLTAHKRVHDQDPATRPFKCDKCGMSFFRNSHLSRHVTTVHLRLQPFQCLECDQKFGQKGDLTRHLSGVHLGIRYPCRKPHCAKSFTQEGSLRRHEKQDH